MTQQDIAENDARQLDRADTLKGALIVFGPSNTRLRCLVTNLTTEGAELEISGDARVPDRFVLDIPHEGVSHRAEVRWREAGRLGVALHGESRLDGPKLKIVGG